MALDIGKVGMVMKGAWSSSATYEVLDAVSYNHGLYIAKKDVPAGTDPTNTSYWQLGADDESVISETVDLSTIDPSLSGSIYCKRNGRTVYLNIVELKSTSNLSPGAVVSSAYRPTPVAARGIISAGDGSSHYLRITTSGALNIEGMEVNQTYNGSILYIN